MLLACLVPMAVVSISAVQQSSSTLESSAFKELETIRNMKAARIEDVFARIEGQIVTYSESRMIVDAMREFGAAFRTLPTELQVTPDQLNNFRSRVAGYYDASFQREYQQRNDAGTNGSSLVPSDASSIIAQYYYIANNPNPLGSKENMDQAQDGSAYSLVHNIFHPVIRSYLQEFEYYDISLIDAQTGDIVYSVYKEVDFGTNLRRGPYSNSSLAEAFEGAVDSGQSKGVVLTDFAAYLPSYDSPASFIASPIYDAGKMIGVLAFQMPISTIDGIMQEGNELGETGEAYLVGADGLMRSQSRFSEVNTILETEAGADAVAGLRGKEAGIAEITGYRGNSVLAAYAPLEVRGLDCGIVAEIEQAEALGQLSSLQMMLAGTSLGGALLAILIGFFIAAYFYKQLGAEPAHLNKITDAIALGNFDLDLEAEGEAQGLFSNIRAMYDQLKETAEQDQQAVAEKDWLIDAVEDANTYLMIADQENNIKYMNKSMVKFFVEVQDDIRQHLGHFDPHSLLGKNMDEFHKNPPHQRNMIANLKSTYKTEIQMGSRTFRLVANPAWDKAGDRVGTVVEWFDVTADVAVGKEVQMVAQSAQYGDLSKRIDVSTKSGTYASMAREMNALVEVADEIIQDVLRVLRALAKGQLTQHITSEYMGVFGELKENANTTVSKLTKVVQDIQYTSRSVKSGAQDIARGNTDLSQRTEQQASSLGNTASSMEEMTSTVKQNASNAAEANDLAQMLRDQAEKGGVVVRQAVEAMSEINSSSKRISEIIGVIDEIAFQTNLLALNAAVEAARAGEQGRGFAVVATEVRNLAGRSATAAKEIKELIRDSSQKVEEGSRLVTESGETLDTIVTGVKKVTDIVGEIAAASQEQSVGIDQINRAITNMDALTQQNASLVSEAAAASRLLEDQANGLSNLVEFFETNPNEDPSNVVEDLMIMNAMNHDTEAGAREMARLNPAPSSDYNENDQDWSEF